MKQRLRCIILYCLLLMVFACSNNEIEKPKNTISYKEISIEIIQKYWPEAIPKNEGYLFDAQVLESNNFVYDYYKENLEGGSIRLANIDTLKDKEIIADSNKFRYINIDNILRIISYIKNKEYLPIDFDNISIKAFTNKKINITKKYQLFFDNSDFKIIYNNKPVLSYVNDSAFIICSKLYSDLSERMYCMYNYNDHVVFPENTIVKIENGTVTDLIPHVRDFAFISNSFVCINTFSSSEVPSIPQESATEEYSINVYDINGNLIKNLDKELYEKYGLLAFPDSISINSQGYGAMTGAFVFNYGKEDQYNFRGIVIFRLVEIK